MGAPNFQKIRREDLMAYPAILVGVPARTIALVLVAYQASLFSTALAQEPDDDGAAAGVAAASALRSTEPVVERYLVTYLKSRIDAPRSATVVTVTNQSKEFCSVKIDWFQGLVPETPACTTTAVVDTGVTHDFCSRDLLSNITTCNSTCDPELAFAEGKAIVSSSKSCSRIGVESRVYYTTGDTSDTGVAAVSNPKIVPAGEDNRGDWRALGITPKDVALCRENTRCE
jgi:hypothetical protein